MTTVKFVIKMSYLASTVYYLLSVRLLCWLEAILASYRSLGFPRLEHKKGSGARRLT